MSSTAQPPGRRKLVHHLDTPFSTISWPEISPDDQDTILELLCNLLSPLGQHRRAHIKRSKGKRAARRGARPGPGPEDRSLPSAPAPPKPELSAKVDVGFNSITRGLEELSQSTGSRDSPCQSYSMVFVARGNQSSAFNCHFPKMIGAASKDSPQADKTRLVGFSKPCSDRLSSVLGVARVSSVAVARDAPGAGALWEFVQKTVAPVSMSWLQDMGCTEYREAKINSVETLVGAKKAKTA
ncbi:RNase p and RNase mrp subunit [Hirsutella rhossiliensis]|uniref:RNase p and RNase mrp subunit n=1 Tax=Hirsutella rhossiliensis TaxID=111463 RepID=A0A9P8SI73_9HYPO|nr:RNase p and RNase mrp subunit [Hirsutella rhossiliensis]KAH0963586.1 RNase p and RNase mrp subunit [Hirsutella rhossiliensis]